MQSMMSRCVSLYSDQIPIPPLFGCLNRGMVVIDQWEKFY